MGASAILKLQKVGFTSDQVEALADFMDTQAASKADLGAAKAELKADIAEVKAELKADIAEVKAEIASVRTEFKAELDAAIHRLDMKIANLQSDVRLMEQRVTIRLGGMMVVAVGVLLAAIRYLPPAAP